MSARRARWRGLLALGLAAAASAGAAACTDVGTDPNAPFAIELAPQPFPSIVLGDSLRDSAGQVIGLHAIVFNAQGDTIPGAPVRYYAIDTVPRIAIDSITGALVALDTGLARVVARIGSLQSVIDTVLVVPAPTALLAISPLRDTVQYDFFRTAGQRDSLISLGVRLVRVAGTDTIAVPSYLVRYRFAYPDTVTNVDPRGLLITDLGEHPALVDTTGGDGAAARFLLLSGHTLPYADSVVIVARAVGPAGQPQPDSVRYVVQLTVTTQ